MADFRTHMGVSTGAGVLYAVAGSQSGIHWTTCLLAGGLCSVSGMLPDLDSDSGRPLREATTLAAAAIVGMAAFLVMSSEDISIRMFKTMAVVLGFISHLVIDEIWAVDFRKGKYQFKTSFGTALKLWSNNSWANYATYFKVAVLAFLVYQDHGFMQRFGIQNQDVPHTARELLNLIMERGEQWVR